MKKTVFGWVRLSHHCRNLSSNRCKPFNKGIKKCQTYYRLDGSILLLILLLLLLILLILLLILLLLQSPWRLGQTYYRLDGSTPAMERERLIQGFNNNTQVSIITHWLHMVVMYCLYPSNFFFESDMKRRRKILY